MLIWHLQIVIPFVICDMYQYHIASSVILKHDPVFKDYFKSLMLDK